MIFVKKFIFAPYFSTHIAYKEITMSRDRLFKGRVSLPNYAYHLTFCTENRNTVFTDFACARVFINELKSITTKGEVNTLAWVVMPDHIHWLVQLNHNTKLHNIAKTVKAK